MSTYVLIHGAGDSGWYWHLVEAELRARGHHTVAPDLPADDDGATLSDYADVVVAALDDAGETDGDVIVVGQSFGAFTAPLVVDRVQASGLVLVAGMVPRPGETPDDWWAKTGYAEAAAAQAALDGGLTGTRTLLSAYYQDVPEPLARHALAHEREHPVLRRRRAALAARPVAGRAHPLRAVHRGPVVPLHVPAQGRPRPAGRRTRRARQRSLLRTRPPRGAGAAARRLPVPLTRQPCLTWMPAITVC